MIVSPQGQQSVGFGMLVDSAFTVLLLDSLGRALPGVPVRFRVIQGDGTFVDSNGINLIIPADSLAVVTDSNGMARAGFKAGVADSIMVAADIEGNPKVLARYFVMRTYLILDGLVIIHFKSIPDSIVPDSTNPQKIIVDMMDPELVKAVKLRITTATFTLREEGGLVLSAFRDTVIVDSVLLEVPIDSARFEGTIPAKPLGTLVKYEILMIDAQYNATVSDTHSYLVGPRRGKYNLSPEPTNVADLLRCVWLVLGAAEPTVVDYLGLDLDSSGYFDTRDLQELLDLWKNSVMLSGVLAGERMIKIFSD